MRQILRGFTMFVGGDDYGYEVEELGIVIPTETYSEHKERLINAFGRAN